MGPCETSEVSLYVVKANGLRGRYRLGHPVQQCVTAVASRRFRDGRILARSVETISTRRRSPPNQLVDCGTDRLRFLRELPGTIRLIPSAEFRPEPRSRCPRSRPRTKLARVYANLFIRSYPPSRSPTRSSLACICRLRPVQPRPNLSA